MSQHNFKFHLHRLVLKHLSELKLYIYAVGLALIVITLFFLFTKSFPKHQTFKNADYSFSFDYASKAKIGATSDTLILNFSPSTEGRIEIDFNNLYQLEYPTITSYPLASFKINNLSVYLQTKVTEGGVLVPEYFIYQNNRIIRFTVIAVNSSVQKKFDKLLSTFKINAP